jgi:hypothetical protein
MRWAGHVSGMGMKRNACRILVGNGGGHYEDQDLCRCVGNIKVDLR